MRPDIGFNRAVAYPFTVTSGVKDISAGQSFYCVLLASDASVRCIGANSKGQLGSGAAPSQMETSFIAPSLLGNTTNLGCGSEHCCAVDTLGGVKCWGNDFYGQLGNNVVGGVYTTPQQVILTVPALQVVAGSGHTCVLVIGGVVKCSGLLGSLSNAVMTPVLNEGASGTVVKIASGKSHMCLLKSDGVASCWGLAESGQLGVGVFSPQFQSSPIFQIGSGLNITNIFAGGSGTCFSQAHPEAPILCTGYNLNGQTGNSGTSNVAVPQVFSTISGGNVIAMALSDETTCVLQSDETVSCLGRDLYYALGNGPPVGDSLALVAVSFTAGTEVAPVGVVVGAILGCILSGLALVGLVVFGMRKRRQSQTYNKQSGLERPSSPPVAMQLVAKPTVAYVSAKNGKYKYLAFFSYAKIDAVSETVLLYSHAQRKFPKHKVFRDAEMQFKLDELISEVKEARNVIILLSYNYVRRPFTLVELHTALQCGAHICTVKIAREGLKPFDFEQINHDIKENNISSYLDEEGWAILQEFNISPLDVAKDLKEIMNVRAFDFSTSLAINIQRTMMEEIFTNGLVMDMKKYPRTTAVVNAEEV